MKVIRVYDSAKNFLATHKRLSLILSHGGIHLLVLLVLTTVIIIFSVKLHRMSRRDYVVSNIELQDTTRSSVLTDLQFYCKPVFDKNGNEKGSREIFSTFYEPKELPLSRTSLAPLAPYLGADTILGDHNSFMNIAHALAYTVPDSIFDKFVFSYGMSRREFQNKVISAINDETKKHNELYEQSISKPYSDGPLQTTFIENYQSLTNILKLNGWQYDLSTKDRIIKVVLSSSKIFGGGIRNITEEQEDSTLLISGLNDSCGLEIFMTREKSNNDVNELSGNFWGKHSGNPYYMGRLNFKVDNFRLRESSKIVLDFSPSPSKAHSVVVFDRIYPSPTLQTVNKIEYMGKDDVEEVLRSGIYLEAHDVTEAYKADRLYILYSVLLGTLIAFGLDIIVRLIYKWRRL